METVKKEFEDKFVARYKTTGMDNWEPQYKLPISSSAEIVWQFIEEKLNNQKNELATSALGYLEYLQKDQHKVSLGSVKHDQTVKLFIPDFFHKVFQRTVEEIEKTWEDYYQQGIDDFEQKLQQQENELATLREQLAEMARLRDFWHKETQKEHVEMELERAKAIDECITAGDTLVKDYPIFHDGKMWVGDYQKILSRLKEV